MPTLTWIGKEKVITHHHDVPFKVLSHQYTFNGANPGVANSSPNKIIHGDNLEALKALLPEYEGKIKCASIDPPYNTGNEHWVYNDNVNHPRLKRWLGQVVGKDSEDLSRHDKWLCMMYPRLVLLHKLLATDGVILISIDDNEQAHLKLLCDEIFGKSNYLTSFVWRRRASSQMSQNNLSIDHEYVVAYSKSDYSKFGGLQKDYKNYSNKDNDPKGLWTTGDLTVGMTKSQRPNQFYDLIDPDTNVIFKANPKRVWTYAPDTMKAKVLEKRVIFPKTDNGRPMLKRYLSDLKTDINPLSSWLSSESYPIGLNSEGTKTLQSLFEGKVFDYPKPTSLLQILLPQLTNNDDVILDSFAGSGTTAHAVLNLNKQDGGNRKFILIEMEGYAETITAERVKRVIKGYAGKEGTGGSFDYYELGESLFIGENEEYLNEAVGIDQIKSYVWYSETRTHWTPVPTLPQNDSFLGFHENTAYYFIYHPTHLTSLDFETLATISEPAGQYIIYADNCLLSKEFLFRNNIVFKKIPRDISRF